MYTFKQLPIGVKFSTVHNGSMNLIKITDKTCINKLSEHYLNIDEDAQVWLDINQFYLRNLPVGTIFYKCTDMLLVVDDTQYIYMGDTSIKVLDCDKQPVQSELIYADQLCLPVDMYNQFATKTGRKKVLIDSLYDDLKENCTKPYFNLNSLTINPNHRIELLTRFVANTKFITGNILQLDDTTLLSDIINELPDETFKKFILNFMYDKNTLQYLMCTRTVMTILNHKTEFFTTRTHAVEQLLWGEHRSLLVHLLPLLNFKTMKTLVESSWICDLDRAKVLDYYVLNHEYNFDEMADYIGKLNYSPNIIENIKKCENIKLYIQYLKKNWDKVLKIDKLYIINVACYDEDVIKQIQTFQGNDEVLNNTLNMILGY